MTGSQPPQKVRLTETREGFITCPECHKRQKKSFASFLGLAPQLRVKCGCGARFRVLLEIASGQNTRNQLPVFWKGAEMRTYYRKRTELPGTYTTLPPRFCGQIIVVNLSFSGISFVTTTLPPLRVGDLLELRFRLDNPQQSVLCKRAEVKYVHGKTIGAVFCHLNAYEKDMRFYLKDVPAELGM